MLLSLRIFTATFIYSTYINLHMAEKIRFFPMYITYKVIGDRAVIFLFGRTIDGKQICVTDSSFEPYFYVIPKKGHDIKEKLKKLRIEKENNISYVTKIEEVKKNFLGKEVRAIKVYANLPKSIPVLREVVKVWESIDSINEYDILFTRKYLIDKDITPMTLVEVEGNASRQKFKVPVVNAISVKQFSDDTIKNPRILAFDIETYNPLGKQVVPEQNPIIMVGFAGENFKKVITWKHFKTDEKFIEFVNSEAQLLNLSLIHI